MPPTPAELSVLLSPLVPDSLQHNARVLSQIRSLTSLVLGVSAGILGLESQYGFLYYFVANLFISALIHFVLAGGQPGLYFEGSGEEIRKNGKGKGRVGAWIEVWLGSGLFESLSGFVLGWAGVGGVIR